MPLYVSLQGVKGEVYGEANIEVGGKEWKKYTAVITAGKTDTAARLLVLAKTKGKLAMDVISLFPENTFKKRPNGLRADLAQKIADLHPKFMRFPGGCLVHGDGLGNMYRWKNTIGPVEQRVEQRDIWNYHQTVGLGYFEYFQFCEDIGAKPLPVLAAGVSCQNSGGTWRIGGTGQRGIPMDEMKDYIQEVLDLIEYANGPVTSAWGAKRAEAGHPAPFNLQYVGIGNEDKQTDAFRDRFGMIYEAVKAKHPEITVVGTVGPFPSGEDYELGWKLADKLNIPVVDEHYYQKPEWFLTNNRRYDGYDRSKSKVYVGEYASWGNTLFNALAEAAYMTGLERNGDVVRMASYAPLLANLGHTSWNPDLIYFTHTSVVPTVNYYVQQLFAVHSGDVYYPGVVSFQDGADTLLGASCVKDSKTGDIILKIVNAGAQAAAANVQLPKGSRYEGKGALYVLTGKPDEMNTLQDPEHIVPSTSGMTVGRSFTYRAPAYSLSVIRVKGRK
jgi:alpha-L-arabinofuranosidase